MIEKIADINLDEYSLEFGPNNFYYEHLSNLTNKKISEAFGYLASLKSSVGVSYTIRKGRIKASRLKLMCNNLHKDPNEIISKYQPRVFLILGNNTIIKGSTRSKEVEESVRNAVYKAICDKK